MKIGLYISELLMEHESVSLPGLGVFNVQIRPSRFSEDGKHLLPPSRQIHFIPEVRINDGLLLNHIAHRHGIAAPRAYLELTGICDDIQYRLDHGEVVTLEGLGKLGRSKGVFHFEMLPDAETHPGSFGLEAVTLDRYKKDSPGLQVTKAASAKPAQSARKKKTLLLIALISGVILLVFLYWVIPVNKKNNGDLPQRSGPAAGMPAEMPEQSEPLFNDSLKSQDHDQVAATIEQTLTVHPAKGLYYLVGGSFRTRENAEQFFSKMAGKGFEPVHLGEIGSFHVVAISVYADMTEAARAQGEMLSKDSLSGVWVYYLPDSE
jgi:nucleoid DNA-binding protein